MSISALEPVPRGSAREVDVIFRTPFTCWAADSRGEVTKASIASGDAPPHVALTVRRG